MSCRSSLVALFVVVLAVSAVHALPGTMMATGMATGETHRQRLAAVTRLVGGEIRLFHDRLHVLYDFRLDKEAEDFRIVPLQENPDAVAGTVVPVLSDGEIGIPQRAALRLDLPFRTIDRLQFTVTGIRDVTVRLRGTNHQINVWLGDVTLMNTHPETLANTFEGAEGTRYNFYPWLSYRVEMSIRASRAVVSVDGVTILSLPLPEDFTSVRDVRFSTRSPVTEDGAPAIEKLDVAGMISRERLGLEPLGKPWR